jgi:hypothetical protein
VRKVTSGTHKPSMMSAASPASFSAETRLTPTSIAGAEAADVVVAAVF